MQDVLVTGSRSLVGINYLKQYFQENGHFCSTIVYIESSEGILRIRYNQREGKELSESDFRALLKGDEDMGLLDIRPVADHFILNECDDKKFREDIDTIFFRSLGFEKQLRGLGEGIFRSHGKERP